ncbi:MAG: porin family protein [Tenacibaculum sp.]
MRKLLLIAIIAIGYTVNAQDIHFGAKAGLNVSILKGDDIPEDAKSRISFHLGGVVEFKLSEKFSLQPELIYSVQGSKWLNLEGLNYVDENGINVTASDVDFTLKLDYINIPLIAKYYVTEGLSLEAGPQIGINVVSEGEVKTQGVSTTVDLKELGAEIKSTDFSLNLGAGYKLKNGLNFGVRYNLGLTSISDSNEDEDVKNEVFQFSVGYFF